MTRLDPTYIARVTRLDFTGVLKVIVKEGNLAWAPTVVRGLSLSPQSGH